MNKKDKFKHSYRAIHDWKATLAAREQLLDSVETTEDLERWQRVEDVARGLVQIAFYWDTHQINCKANCMLVSPVDVMRMIGLAPGYDQRAWEAHHKATNDLYEGRRR